MPHVVFFPTIQGQPDFFHKRNACVFCRFAEAKDWSPGILSRHSDQGLARVNKQYYIEDAMFILHIIERFLLRAGSLQASLTAPGVCGA
jgi:hypothetical protein